MFDIPLNLERRRPGHDYTICHDRRLRCLVANYQVIIAVLATHRGAHFT